MIALQCDGGSDISFFLTALFILFLFYANCFFILFLLLLFIFFAAMQIGCDEIASYAIFIFIRNRLKFLDRAEKLNKKKKKIGIEKRRIYRRMRRSQNSCGIQLHGSISNIMYRITSMV